MSFEQNLDRVLARFEELQSLMASNPLPPADELMQLSIEYASLTPVVEAISRLREVKCELKNLEVILEDKDEDMRILAGEEQRELQARLPELLRTVQIMLLPKDEADSKNVILEVRAGTGGDEAGLFAADLFRMYQRYCEHRKWNFEVMGLSDTGLGGYKEVVASISGSNAHF